MRNEDDEDDPPRRSRNRRRDRDEEDEFDREDYEEDDRPWRRRRRPPPPDRDDPAMEFIVPLNTSALAIAAGYVGLISVLCIPAPLAVLLGILALRQLNRNPKLHGRYRAIFALVMGILCSIPIPFILYALIQNK
jgi:hypothetical protein